MIHFRAERFDLRGVGLQHRPFAQPLDDAHAMARGNRVDVAGGAVDDDVDRADRFGLDVLAEARGEPARLGPERGGGQQKSGNGEGERTDDAHEFLCAGAPATTE